MFYSYNRIRSYNAYWSFIISNRGGGKTYGFKEMCIKDFIKKGEQFVYVRRYKSELEDRQTFFDDIKDKFPEHELKVQGKKALIDGKVAGYFIPLSTSRNKKSVPYPLVTKIGFDEFIVQKTGTSGGYLKDEVTTMLELCSTITRKRDNVRVFFMGNNISLVNPYFVYFKCIPRTKERFHIFKDGELAIEMFADDGHIQEMKETKMGKLVSGTNYENYAIENNSLIDNNKFLYSKMPQDARFLFSVTFKGQTLGFWISYKEGFIFVNKSYMGNKYRFAITKEDHDVNFVMYNRLNEFSLFKEFVKYFKNGYALFNGQEVKNQAFEILEYMNVR